MQVAYGFCICLPVFLSRMVASFMCGLASLIRWSHSSSVRKLPYLAYARHIWHQWRAASHIQGR